MQPGAAGAVGPGRGKQRYRNAPGRRDGLQPADPASSVYTSAAADDLTERLLPRVDELAVLGEGAFAVVFEGRLDQKTPHEQSVAIKALGPSADSKMLEHEGRLLSKCGHPNVVELFGYATVKAQRVLVLERLAGTLFDRLSSSDQPLLTPEDRVRVADDVAQAVVFVHSRAILHLDIKVSSLGRNGAGDVRGAHVLRVLPLFNNQQSNNVGLTHDATGRLVAKLIDFGLATEYSDSEGGQDSPQSAWSARSGMGGCMLYMAPEVSKSCVHWSSDWYSFGWVLMELLRNRLLERAWDMEVHRKSNKGTKWEGLKGLPDDKLNWPSKVAWPLLAVANACLRYDHKDRPDATEVKEVTGWLLEPGSRECPEEVLRRLGYHHVPVVRVDEHEDGGDVGVDGASNSTGSPTLSCRSTISTSASSSSSHINTPVGQIRSQEASEIADRLEQLHQNSQKTIHTLEALEAKVLALFEVDAASSATGINSTTMTGGSAPYGPSSADSTGTSSSSLVLIPSALPPSPTGPPAHITTSVDDHLLDGRIAAVGVPPSSRSLSPQPSVSMWRRALGASRVIATFRRRTHAWVVPVLCVLAIATVCLPLYYAWRTLEWMESGGLAWGGGGCDKKPRRLKAASHQGNGDLVSRDWEKRDALELQQSFKAEEKYGDVDMGSDATRYYTYFHLDRNAPGHAHMYMVNQEVASAPVWGGVEVADGYVAASEEVEVSDMRHGGRGMRKNWTSGPSHHADLTMDSPETFFPSGPPSPFNPRLDMWLKVGLNPRLHLSGVGGYGCVEEEEGGHVGEAGVFHSPTTSGGNVSPTDAEMVVHGDTCPTIPTLEDLLYSNPSLSDNFKGGLFFGVSFGEAWTHVVFESR